MERRGSRWSSHQHSGASRRTTSTALDTPPSSTHQRTTGPKQTPTRRERRSASLHPTSVGALSLPRSLSLSPSPFPSPPTPSLSLYPIQSLLLCPLSLPGSSLVSLLFTVSLSSRFLLSLSPSSPSSPLSPRDLSPLSSSLSLLSPLPCLSLSLSSLPLSCSSSSSSSSPSLSIPRLSLPPYIFSPPLSSFFSPLPSLSAVCYKKSVSSSSFTPSLLLLTVLFSPSFTKTDDDRRL